MQKIDTHQHLFYPSRFRYSWTRDFPALQGSFELEHYRQEAEGTEIIGSLFMEVDVDPGDPLKEAAFFTEMANDPASSILGIIAKASPEDSDFQAQLEALDSPQLKGIRRVLHTRPDALSQTSRFRDNLKTLAQNNLSFDLCVKQSQLQLAARLVHHCPQTRFILDHCGSPEVAAHADPDSGSWREWQSGLRGLAQYPNVCCKLSALTTCAPPEKRNSQALRPYIDEMLEAFGTTRIVWGGDWPVCKLADGLHTWSELSESLLQSLSETERQDILRTNATRLYQLTMTPDQEQSS